MPDLFTLSFPSCGSAVIETEIYCRKCGARLLDGNEKLI
jgi:hypothetical protein